MMKLLTRCLLLAVLVTTGFSLVTPAVHAAASPATPNDFSLQVTPSPLVTTVRPGDQTNVELRIRNGGTGTENLKIETRSFKINSGNGRVTLSDSAPAEVAPWVSFASPKFTVASGEWFTETVRFAVPKEAGFSYSFALVISRQTETKPTSAGRLIKGSVAVFTLVNVDRPGATRQMGVAKFGVSKRFYEYLPADIQLELKNTGNSIVQPYGSVFIQRKGSTKPISVLAVNDQRGYFLPGVTRSLDLQWNEGFPHYRVTSDDKGTHRTLTWNWSDASKFRIGRYTAKLVAVYNDGGHDVPIEGEVSFWVIPWKILLGALIVLLLVLFGLWSLGRKIYSIIRRISGKKPKPTSKDTPDTKG